MRTSGRSSLALPMIACAVLFVGCVPIPNTKTVSPAVVGTVRRADGTPAAGVPLALSTDRDSTCTRASLRTASDAEGRFEFAKTRRREKWLPVLFERLLCYNVCGGPAAGDLIYEACALHYVPAVDSIACAESTAPASGGAPRTTCAAVDRRRRR